MNSFLPRIKNWIFSKFILFFLLLVVLTLINFFCHGITPLWMFISQSEQQYEIRKSTLKDQIDKVKAEKLKISNQIIDQSENRPSKLLFWKSKEYDAQIHGMRQYFSVLQIKENRLKTQLLSLEKPSFIHVLQIFWLSFQKNLFMVGWLFLFVLFVPDLWLYLKMNKKYKGLFSTEQLDKNDLFWFFFGRIEAKNYRKNSLAILFSAFVVSIPHYYFENVEESATMWLLSLSQIFLIGLTSFGIVLTVKRLHDIDRNGKQAWLLFLPLYNIYLFTLLFFKKSNIENNHIFK